MKSNEQPNVPQYLREKEAAQGCRPNVYAADSRRLDPHEAAMVEHHTAPADRKPVALLGLSRPVATAVFYLGLLGAWIVGIGYVGHQMGWW